MLKKQIQNSSKRGFTKKTYGIIVITCALLVGITSYQMYKNILSDRQVKKFGQIEGTLSGTRDQINQLLGMPVQSEMNSYCARQGVKYGEGALFCGTRVGENFKVMDATDAENKANKLMDTLKTDRSGFQEVKTGIAIKHNDRWTKDYDLLIKDTDQYCDLQLTYYAIGANKLEGVPGDPLPGTFGYLIRCTDGASKQFYPIGR